MTRVSGSGHRAQRRRGLQAMRFQMSKDGWFVYSTELAVSLSRIAQRCVGLGSASLNA